MSEDFIEDVLTGSCMACGHRMQPEAHYCTSCGAPVLPPPKRRPLFVDEIDDAPATSVATYAEQSGYAAHSQPVPLPPEDPPPFFSNAEPLPQPEPRKPRRPRPARETRRNGRGGVVLLALAVVAVAGVVGFALGRDGDPSAPTGAGTHAPTGSSSSGKKPSSSPSTPPQEQLLRISRTDTHAASRLVGSWVPQLAAVSAGVGGDQGWTDALAHYQQLKSSYPDVLLLDTGEWPSTYVRPGMYAVVVPAPSRSSRPALQWCAEHGLSKDHCAAKQIETEGDPDNNFDAQ